MTYFDNAATTFPKPEIVYKSTMEAMSEYGANPGRSGHKLALKINREIYNTRESLANLFHIKDPMNLIFTFNGTESLNIGIKGFLKAGDHVVTTSMEHNSVLRPIKYLQGHGVESTIVEADILGRINPEDIKKAIKSNTKLIITTHISNLTGTIMPIKEIGKIAKDSGIIYMVDAVYYDEYGEMIDAETGDIVLGKHPMYDEQYTQEVLEQISFLYEPGMPKEEIFSHFYNYSEYTENQVNKAIDIYWAENVE